MNELAARHPNELLVVGVSDESNGTITNYMRQNDMRYSVATDQSSRRKGAIGVSGIPHAIVISSDWIVRWQGHPASLTTGTIDGIVAANKKLGGGSAARDDSRYRWSRERSD